MSCSSTFSPFSGVTTYTRPSTAEARPNREAAGVTVKRPPLHLNSARSVWNTTPSFTRSVRQTVSKPRAPAGSLSTIDTNRI